MADNFHERLAAHEPVPMPSDRSTGLVLAVAATVAAVLFRHTAALIWGFAAVATVLATLALARPQLLAPVTRGWFRLGMLLNRIVSPIVLLILFAVIVAPYGLVMQLFRDPLRRRAKAQSLSTYWVEKDRQGPVNDMSRQF
jgi:hypothetical protein